MVRMAAMRDRVARWGILAMVAAALPGAAAPAQAAVAPAQAAAAAAGVSVPTKAVSDAVPCQEVVFIGARGSGEKTGAGTLSMGVHTHFVYREYLAALGSGSRTSRVGYWAPVRYPARPVADLLTGRSTRFLSGLDAGVQETLSFLSHRSRRCPREHYVLAGYSQGAMVMHRVMWQLTTTLVPRIDGIIVVADGDRHPNQGGLAYGNSDAGRGAQGAALYHRVLGVKYKARASAVRAGLKTRFHSVCAKGDLVCDTRYVRARGSGAARTGASLHARRYLEQWEVTARAVRSVAAVTTDRAPTPPMKITVPRVIIGTVGDAFSQVLSTTGHGTRTGKATTWTVRQGALPPGVTLVPRRSRLDGTMTRVGTFTATLRATDGHGQWVEQPLTVQVGVRRASRQRIATSGEHTCVIVAGALKCWGNNTFGQLGDSTAVHSSTPVQVTGLASGVVSVTAGGRQTCALLSTGTVKCWGSFYDDIEIGGPNPVPAQVRGLPGGVQAISVGDAHSCAVLSTGAVACWGWPRGVTPIEATGLPTQVSGLTSGVTAVAAGFSHTCALLSTGAVKCWGMNDEGQLGDGTTRDSVLPVQVKGLTGGVRSISAGFRRSCAVLLSGAVMCWGGGSTAPARVPGLAGGVTAVGADPESNCALLSTGAVRCWGANDGGQLGNGTTVNSANPLQVTGLTSGVTSLAAGGRASCALLGAGAVTCWGRNGYGQLGNGTTVNSTVPVQVSGLP